MAPTVQILNSWDWPEIFSPLYAVFISVNKNPKPWWGLYLIPCVWHLSLGDRWATFDRWNLEWLERLAVNAKFATELGTILASSDKVKSFDTDVEFWSKSWYGRISQPLVHGSCGLRNGDRAESIEYIKRPLQLHVLSSHRLQEKNILGTVQCSQKMWGKI